MYLLMPVIFIIGYLFIALEHPLKVDKSASAILTGVACWTLLVIVAGHGQGSGPEESHFAEESLLEHLGDIASILFFLLGAMTIVELIDIHEGFSIITDKVQTEHKAKLLWGLSFLTFFLSAALDNLTTAIVMAALLRKLIHKKEDLWFFAGMVVIAANAGGAWSPIGDVTTIMLWIGGQVTALNIVKEVFLPSILCLLAPLAVASFMLKDNLRRPERALPETEEDAAGDFEKKLILALGVGALLFVPVFKSITHLPPFMGVLLGLGVLWVVTEVRNGRKTYESKRTVVEVLHRIDVSSVLFFLGILLAVAALETAGYLEQLATALDTTFGSIYTVNILIGLLSSVVDNVPLVAGAMGMYPLSVQPPDSKFWELLAYCAGTGGSVLIIGSAAGVAIMGILRIEFIWYLKRVSWLALLGYFAGVATYYLLNG
ncbi:MAG: sodium:proton antiporter NhaD [Lewinellaceae bacterium]|nr:sodium:proton antiporter NhaD [Lewinellaceae bacterium]